MSYAIRPGHVKTFQMFFRVADSAAVAKAPPATVKLTITAQDTLP
jgi:hypothetical protein